MQIQGCKPITEKISSRLQRNRNIAFAMAVSLGVLVAPPAQADLNNGLVAYFPFNGNANDESGNGNHGAVYGATLTEDRFGNASNAYHFDGDDWITIWSTDGLNENINTYEGSVSVWFNVSEIPNKSSFVFQYYSGDRLYLDAGESSSSGGKLRLGIGDTHRFSEMRITSANWYHVVAIWESDGSTKLYINGILDSEGRFGNPGFEFRGEFYFGRGWSGNRGSYNGIIDDVRLYNRALSESEIQQLYNLEVACIQVITWGKKPQTGEWVQFPTCDVPEGWETSNTDPGYEAGYQAGLSACTTQEGPHAVFSTDGKLHIPYVDVSDIFGGMTTYKADMILIPDAERLLFSVIGATPVQ